MQIIIVMPLQLVGPLTHAHWLGPVAQLHVQTMCLYDIPHLYIPRRARGGGIELIPPALWQGEHGGIHSTDISLVWPRLALMSCPSSVTAKEVGVRAQSHAAE